MDEKKDGKKEKNPNPNTSKKMITKREILIFVFSLLFLIFFLFSANLAFALEIKYPKIPGVLTPQQFLKEIEEGTIEKEKALSLYVKYLFYLFLMIGGLVTLGSTIFGGVKYLISGGNVPAMRDARETISAGILGLVILFSSFSIITLINPQLTFFHVSELKKVVFPEIETLPPTEKEPPVYFQVPVGKIIENAIDEEKLNYVKEVAIETELASENLKNLTEGLKKLTEECQCGTSKCGDPPGCSGSCPKASCPEELIEVKIEEIGQAIKTLEEKQILLRLARGSLLYDFSQLRAAGVLMSLASGVIDYNTLLTVKHYQEIETTSFPDWEDIDIEVAGQIIKDPVTFYFSELGNKEAISYAEALINYYAEMAQWGEMEVGLPPEPPEGWPTPPPAVAGTLQWPVAGGRVTSRYGCWRRDCGGKDQRPCACTYLGKGARWHKGIDINSKKAGAPVLAAADGIVFAIGYADAGKFANFGNYVGIKHEQFEKSGLSTFYAHLKDYNVRPGDKVKVGQQIGRVGSSGCIVPSPHLHFEVRNGLANEYREFLDLKPLDPMGYLPPK